MDTEVLENIKKLLRLGQSMNEHEAALALERAFQLAAKHNIDLASVDVDEETKRILHKAFGIGQRISLPRKLAIQIVHNYFNVLAIMGSPAVTLVGTETDVEIAWYVVQFLVNACSRSLGKFQAEERRKLTSKKRRSFIAGFFYGISSKLGAAKKQLAIEGPQNALVVGAEAQRKKYADDHFKLCDYKLNLGKINRDALGEGYVEGRKVEINKAVPGAKKETLQLTL